MSSETQNTFYATLHHYVKTPQNSAKLRKNSEIAQNISCEVLSITETDSTHFSQTWGKSGETQNTFRATPHHYVKTPQNSEKTPHNFEKIHF